MKKTYLVSLLSFLLLLPCVAEETISERDKIFAKLDKDGDKVIALSELPQQMQSRLGARLDADSDKKITVAEFAKLPDQMIERMSQRLDRMKGMGKGGNKPGRKPGEVIAPAARSERSDSKTAEIGKLAPEFKLPLAEGEGEVGLVALRGKKPVVLIFGSITCSPFRDRVVEINPIHQSYKDRAEFLMVYIREAHPESKILTPNEEGKEELRIFTQTDDFSQRLEYAQVCTRLLSLTFPSVVDLEDNKVKDAYGAWPNRIVVIDQEGKLAWDSGQGPKGFQPAKLREWLEENL